MKKSKTYKIYVCMFLLVTAVVLGALSLHFFSKDTIYVYTSKNIPNKSEQEIVKDFQEAGYRVILNKAISKKAELSFWFRNPETIKDIMSKTTFKYNFIYSNAYYTFDWEGLDKLPIVLTPYQEVYEHYMRSNIKSAVFKIDDKKSLNRLIELINWIKVNN